MEYNWDIEKIRRQRMQTRDLLRKTEGLTKEEKDTLRERIATLKEMEQVYKPPLFSVSFPKRTKYMDSNHMLPTSTYLSNQQDIPYYIKQIILDAIPYFKNYIDTYDDIELPKLNISNQELVEMSHDFYNWLPNREYLKLFEKYTNPKRHLLCFNDPFLITLKGETKFFYYPTYRPYFSIDRDYTINDFITLNHEIAHGIMFRNDTTVSQKNEHYFLTELEGSFFDFLSIEYLKQIMPKGIIQELEYTRFITAYDDFISFYITEYAIKLFQRKGKISVIPIQRKILKDELPFYLDETVLLSSLQNDPKFSAKYLVSYLTSLDLEDIYENDPEKSFYTFEKIRNQKRGTVFNNLNQNGISFVGENDNYKPFQKTIGKMNQLGKRVHPWKD